MSEKKNFNSGRPFSPDEETELQVQQWFTPDLTAELAAKQPRTNALNMANANRKPVAMTEQAEQSIKPLTAADIEEMRQAAYDEGLAEGKEDGFSKGYAEGREQGYQDGMAQGQAEGKKVGLAEAELELTEQRKQLTALLNQLQQPLLAVNEQVKQQLLALSLAMAKAVIGVEAKTNTAVILQAIADATSALPLQSKNVVIKLNPKDLIKVESFYSADELAQHGWQLVAAANLAQGGCLVQSTLSSVDRSLEQRVENSLSHFIELQQLAEQSAANSLTEELESADLEETASTAPVVDEQNYTVAEESHPNAAPKTKQPLSDDDNDQ
ncbi:flagellar assembly protein FliH [Rheinheimera sp. MMS21-TC3]|uniref:flagellar assembly protein FliH n=1 Tax=Rheinheimera sp. MMS21-TC3 TaxID=3072790 RepID=UPI0028C47211|nr:flagellar assembly protein FliH [Rheinheimera sp. MMS21-TC3]WNO61795.1 flagellar assembly protein FliH [Rheinheimera sp. MMS21-TC3]